MPVINRLEKILLTEAHHNIVVVELYFWGDWADIQKKGIEERNDFVPFPLFKFSCKIVVPKVSSNAEVQFIREKEI